MHRSAYQRRLVMGLLLLCAVRVLLLSHPLYGVVGDGHYYLEQARIWVLEGRPPPADRSPGFVLLLSGLLWAVGERQLPVTLTAIQLVLDGAGVVACAIWAGRRLPPGPVAWTLAGALVLQPFTGARASSVLTETTCAWAVAGGLGLWVWGLKRGQVWASGLGMGAGTLAIALRQDVAAAWLPAVVAVAFTAWHRGLLTKNTVRASAFGLALAGASVGAFYGAAAMSEVPPASPSHRGFGEWMGTWFARYDQFKRHFWSYPRSMPPVEALPDRAFDGPDERRRYLAIQSLHQKEPRSLEVTRRLSELAAEKRDAHPWRHFLGLPLLRAVHYWVNPAYTGRYARSLGVDDPILFHALAFLVLLLKGGLTALAFLGVLRLLNRRTREALDPEGLLLGVGSSVLLLARTASLAALGTLWGAGLMEPRYVLVVWPGVLILAVLAISGRRRLHGSSGPPGPDGGRNAHCSPCTHA